MGVNELKRDKTVQDSLNKGSKELFLFHDRTIFPLRSFATNQNNRIKFLVPLKKCATQN